MKKLLHYCKMKYFFHMQILSLLIFFLVGFIYPSYSTDSWSYFELSKSLHNFGYFTDNIRQYDILTNKSISFPFLYPIVLSIFSIFYYSILNGYILNIAVVFFIIFFLFKIDSNKYISFIIISILFINVGFLYEIISARTIPLTLLLMLISFYLLKNNNTGFIFFFILGGLCLIRFDMYPFVSILLIQLFLYSKKCINKYVLVTILLMMCWPVYSFINFDSVFLTENSLLFKQSLPVVDVLYFNYPYINNIYQLLELIFERTFIISVFLIAFIMVINIRNDKSDKEKLSSIYCNSIALSLFFISLTGYTDVRYYSIAGVFFIRHFLCYIFPPFNKKKLATFFLISASVLLILLSLARVYKNFNSNQYAANTNFLKCISKGELTLVISKNKNEGRLLSSKLSALYGVKTIMEPTNLSSSNVQDFIKRYNIKNIYYLNDKPTWLNNSDVYLETSCNSLYQVN